MKARRLAGGMVLIAGLTMAVIPLALDTVTRAHQAQDLLDGARPTVAPPYLDRDYQAPLALAQHTLQLLTGPAFSGWRRTSVSPPSSSMQKWRRGGLLSPVAPSRRRRSRQTRTGS
jgi:hypothetical protein